MEKARTLWNLSQIDEVDRFISIWSNAVVVVNGRISFLPWFLVGYHKEQF